MEPENSFRHLSLMESSSILSSINNIKDKVEPFRFIKQDRETFLHEYIQGLDHLRRIIYINVEIHPDCLDKGSDPTEVACTSAKDFGVRGDSPAQFIGKKLGGDGSGRNVFPLNAKLDTTKWKADEDLVYDHVKEGGNRHAKLMFGIEYSREFEGKIRRPSKIYYYFQLFENAEVVGDTIHDYFQNTSLKLMNNDYYNYSKKKLD